MKITKRNITCTFDIECSQDMVRESEIINLEYRPFLEVSHLLIQVLS